MALDRAKVSIESTYFNDNSAPVGRDVYILDDDDPHYHGSFLKCSDEYHKAVHFHDYEHEEPSVIEVGKPGAFENQNCVDTSSVKCCGYGSSHNDKPVTNGNYNSNDHSPGGSYNSKPDDGGGYPGSGGYNEPVGFPSSGSNYGPRQEPYPTPIVYSERKPVSYPTKYVSGSGYGQ